MTKDFRIGDDVTPTPAAISLETAFSAGEVFPCPLVSIIMTAHNYARYVGECIRSVHAQTYTNFECLVVDDASTDDTRQVVETVTAGWNDARFQVISTPENLGQLGTQVFGFERTRGEFVVFVDADDVLHDNFLERHLFAHLNFEAPVCFTSSDQWTIDGNGTVLSFHHSDLLSRLYTDEGWNVTIGKGTGRAIRGFLLPWNEGHLAFGPWWWGTQSTMMFRRPVLELVLPQRVKPGTFRICSDSYIVRFAQLVGGSLILREALGRYRRHGGNNFSANPLIAARMQTGDMRNHPLLRDFFALALSTMNEKYDRFATILGVDRTSKLLISFKLGCGYSLKWRVLGWVRGSFLYRIIRRVVKILISPQARARSRTSRTRKVV